MQNTRSTVGGRRPSPSGTSASRDCVHAGSGGGAHEAARPADGGPSQAVLVGTAGRAWRGAGRAVGTRNHGLVSGSELRNPWRRPNEQIGPERALVGAASGSASRRAVQIVSR